MASTMRTSAPVRGARAAVAPARSLYKFVVPSKASRGRLVVDAAKKSVGDLGKADLEGKR